MEQTIVDFLAKSSELILSNRLPSPKSQETPQPHPINSKQSKFQLSFEQKFNFSAKIPSQWASNSNKVLVLEFFLVNKTTKEKFLVEHWLFELNQVSGGKLKDTIDSPNTLYKKLSVLLRTISLLTVTLPLYKNFIADKNSALNEHFTIEHSINFTRHTLSSWHSSLHEEKNLAVYNNAELIIPGRAFIFKVNYPKSLDFLEMMVNEQVGLETGNVLVLKEKLDIDYFNPKRRERAISDQTRNLLSIRKSTGDSSNKINTSGGNMSPKEQYPIGSEGVSENLSPFGSLFAASPIETQLSPRQIAEMKRKNSGGSYPWEGKNSAGNRPRFGTVDSASSGEYDMYIYEDGDFTEVVTVREINVRDESPRKFSIHPRASEDEQTFGEASKRAGSHDLRLSPNASKIDKLIEQSDDDKIAEIIKVVDELKDHLHSANAQEISQKSSIKTGGSGSDGSGNEKTRKFAQQGFRFYSVREESVGENNTLSADYEELINLYNRLKK